MVPRHKALNHLTTGPGTSHQLHNTSILNMSKSKLALFTPVCDWQRGTKGIIDFFCVQTMTFFLFSSEGAWNDKKLSVVLLVKKNLQVIMDIIICSCMFRHAQTTACFDPNLWEMGGSHLRDCFFVVSKSPTSPNVILYGINMKAGNPARKLQAICLNLP